MTDPIRYPSPMAPLSVTGALLAALLMLGGCTWVRPTDAGAEVRVIDPQEASACTRLGTVSGQTRTTVMGVDRNADRIGDEVTLLASNEAAALGANAIAPLGELVDGRQRFEALRCP